MFVVTRNNEKYRGNLGVTLVELLVAAAVLGVAVAGLLALVRSMQREQDSEYHRRQARLIINRFFEGAFDLKKFPGDYAWTDTLIVPDSLPNPAKTYKAAIDRNNPVVFGYGSTVTANQMPEVIIDNRWGTGISRKRLRGQIRAVFEYRSVTINALPTAQIVDTHLLTVTVKWTENGETQPDSIVLVKRLAKAVQQ
jgi:prepilin-type N-terminal cleavage/methylation domain-containing protein